MDNNEVVVNDGGPPARESAPLQIQLKVVTENSAILIEARSNVGPISFGTNALAGRIFAHLEGSMFSAEASPAAKLTVDLRSLTSGNTLTTPN